MEIVEKLDTDLVNQLSILYKKIWFTQDRKTEDIARMLDNSYLVLGFIDSGELIGFCRVISDGVYKAFLFDVIVKDGYRNNRIGSMIMKTVLNHDRLKDIDHIELYCPDEITEFYKKLGFQTRTSLLMRYNKTSPD